MKWTQRYLANQNEEDLDRKAIIILDAYASGLLGADSEGVISRQITEWLDHLEEKPGFIEQQAAQWSDAINLQRKPIEIDNYPYLKKYSKTWPNLQDIMEGAELHHRIFDYFSNIFEQETQTGTVKEQLDGILTSLVADFDDEELPLRKKERFEQMVVDFKGDEPRAKNNMAIGVMGLIMCMASPFLGIIAMISRGGFGRHIWLFFNEKIDHQNAAQFGKKIITLAGALPEGLSIEVFPNGRSSKAGIAVPFMKLPFGINVIMKKRSFFYGSGDRVFFEQPAA